MKMKMKMKMPPMKNEDATGEDEEANDEDEEATGEDEEATGHGCGTICHKCGVDVCYPCAFESVKAVTCVGSGARLRLGAAAATGGRDIPFPFEAGNVLASGATTACPRAPCVASAPTATKGAPGPYAPRATAAGAK